MLLLLACRPLATSATNGLFGVATGGTIDNTWAIVQPTGTVILMRHALAPGTGDPPIFRLGDCSTQRNLSPEGRDQARQIGEAFRRHGVVVSRVLSSQWCRCIDTATLLNLGKVEPEPALNSFFGDRSREPQQTAAVQRIITGHRQNHGVMIMVTHQVNITALTGIVPSSGGLVVVRATPEGNIEILGELPLSEPV